VVEGVVLVVLLMVEVVVVVVRFVGVWVVGVGLGVLVKLGVVVGLGRFLLGCRGSDKVQTRVNSCRKRRTVCIKGIYKDAQRTKRERGDKGAREVYLKGILGSNPANRPPPNARLQLLGF
jgi:hypothetical protein